MTPGLLDGLFSRGPSDQAVAELEAHLEGYLGPDERVQYRLPGAGDLVHETGGVTEENSADESLAVVTDHRVLFVARSPDGETVADLPHSDIRRVDLDSGLFKTVLTVECWEDGTYRFRPAGGETSEAVDYIKEASDCWQFVDTLLEELEGHAASIEAAIEAGQFDRVAAVLEEAGETTDELDERVSSAGLESALGDRVAAARHALQRTRIRTRRELARSLVAEAESMHLNGDSDIDYAGAYERYASARQHLSTARSIAEEYDLDASAVRESLEQVEGRVELLARQPVALAKQATERALGTDDAAARVDTMQAALEHYHDALAVGWGTDFDHPYERADLRFRIALLADGLVDAHREYAAQLEAAGDTLAAEDDSEAAREHYRGAVEQLSAAADLAREFRAADSEPIERERARIERKVERADASG